MSLSTLATFDDLRRCQSVLSDGLAEEEFLKFVKWQEECRSQWLVAVHEAQRLQREMDLCLKSMSDLETKLFHARRLLEMEAKARREAEHERDQMEKKMIAVRDLLRNERDIKEETKDKFAFLNTYPTKKRKSSGKRKSNTGNEINSTGSFLSDLSITQSEDDFLDARPSKDEFLNTKTWKKHRPSVPSNTGIYVGGKESRLSGDGKKKKSLNSSRVVEIGPADKIVAHTKVTVPPEGTGPILAESIIEAIPPKHQQEKKDDRRERREPSPRKSAMKTQFTPSAPPLSEIHNKNTPVKYEFKKSLMKNHNFSSKTFLRSDICCNCQNKIRFGAVAQKCRVCRICVHTDCQDTISVACVPQSSGAGTPTIKGMMGVIADYAPNIGPMVPGLIVHCVHEIETRGLNEVGIYRVSGSERDVKGLKERFLRGKGIPFLGNVDVHVLCGCIKDFLRSLREPLIPTDLWKDFCNAVQNISEEASRNELFRSIDRMPQANRDTLAFLIQHFQRIADIPEIKMPVENIARVFGPTIVGYSSPDPDQHAIFTETIIQYTVMERLMRIPTDFWSQFVNVDLNKPPELEKTTDAGGKSFYGTPLKGASARKDRKFYATPPYTLSRKKN